MFITVPLINVIVWYGWDGLAFHIENFVDYNDYIIKNQSEPSSRESTIYLGGTGVHKYSEIYTNKIMKNMSPS